MNSIDLFHQNLAEINVSVQSQNPTIGMKKFPVPRYATIALLIILTANRPH